MTHWPTMQLRHLLTITSGSTPQSGETAYWDGDISWVTPEDVGAVTSGYRLRHTRRNITREGYESCGTTLVPKNSIVLTKRAPIGELAVLDVEACSNQGCLLLTVKYSDDPRFFYYVLVAKASRLQALGRGSTFMELSLDDLKSLRVSIPDVNEQRAIADYLDQETARLDALVAAKERLLGLLAEKRRALITRAVTRGLDPNAPLRDSGLPWLGQIPKHWDAKRLRFTTPEITVGIVVTPAKYYENSGVPCLRSLNVREEGLTDSDLVYISPESNAMLSKSRIFAGDLVAVRSGQPGSTAVVDQRFDGANCIDLIIIRCSAVHDSRFLALFMNSEGAKTQFLTGSGGAIQQHFNIETAKDLFVVVPPLAEQRAIVVHIASETAKLDALRAAAERTIGLLKERRAALIAAAVCGRIDVENVERGALSRS